MAINNKVEITSANAVLDWYDDQPKAAYKLCRGTTLNKDHIVDVYDSTDKDAGYKQLFKVITRLANEVSNTNTYFICMTGKGTELLATTTFQLNTFQIGNVNNGGNDYRANNEMLSRLAAIEQKLNEEEEINFTKAEFDLVLRFAEVELGEWAKFVKLLKYKIKHKKNGTNTK